MLDFMKANPWTFVVGAIIIVGALAGVIIGVVKKGNWTDRGLMKRGDQYLKHRKKDLPLAVWYPINFPDWAYDAFRRVREHFTEAIGRELFDIGTEAPPDFHSDLLAQGHIFIQIGDNPQEGSTEHRYDTRSGQIISAVVRLSPKQETAYSVTLHELGHVLGLDHDEQIGSIMYPSLQGRPQALTESDIELLKKLYG